MKKLILVIAKCLAFEAVLMAYAIACGAIYLHTVGAI